jgi:hypothetical protein
MSKNKERPVIITTDKRGVFFGYTEDFSDRAKITLKRARMCVYWSEATKGIFGLAAKGPAKGSKISDAIPSVDLYDVHAVLEPSEEAVARWEEGPWA